MQKQTLAFMTLEQLAAFTRNFSHGYLINTNTLTLTGHFMPEQVQNAVNCFGAVPTLTTDNKAYNY